MDDLKFDQARLRHRTSYRLGPDTFGYSIWSEDAKTSFDVRYETLNPFGVFSRSVRTCGFPHWMPALLIPLMIFGGLIEDVSKFAAACVMLVAILLLATSLTIIVVRPFWLNYTVFPTSDGRMISILKDDTEPAILEELKKRWRARTRIILMPLDLTVDLAQQQAKYDWMLQVGLVDAQEHAEALKRIKMSVSADVKKPVGPLN